ncbi:4-hydroxyphenylacetate 3-monooxygenase oxygenase component, partial [human gut metagenome]
TGLYFNHAIVNPPIDRHLPTDKVKDVYIKLEKETDAGIIVSGAKGINNGDRVTVSSKRGFIRAVAVVTRRLKPLNVNGQQVETV